MLSRVATPSACLTKRAFTTSIALRAGPNDPKNDDTPPRVRSNPLVGNSARVATPERNAPETRTYERRTPQARASPQTQPPPAREGPAAVRSDLPPPPPPAASATEAEPKP
ncbi:hypothetical protein FZEAL_4352, partial [Fusarium zealandicum]